MELRSYAKIIWRYIWLIVLIVAVVSLYSGYQYYKLRKTQGALTGYSSNISLQIGLIATTSGDSNPADEVSVSESLAETLVLGPILTSAEFTSDISRQIGQDMGLIEQKFSTTSPELGNYTNTGALGASLSASRVDNLVTITTNWTTPMGAWAITNAIGEIATARMGQYLDYVVATDYTHATSTGQYAQPEVSARIVGAASLASMVPGSSASKVTMLLLLILIALAVGIALAFLLDYLDDRIRSTEDVKDLFQLPIYGEVPQAPTPGHIARPGSDAAV